MGGQGHGQQDTPGALGWRGNSIFAMGLSRASLPVRAEATPRSSWGCLGVFEWAQSEQQPLGRVSGAGRLSVEQTFLSPALLPKPGPVVAGQG